MVPGPAVAAVPVSVLKMHILRPHPSPPESAALGPGPAIWVFTSIPRDSDVLKTEDHCLVPRNRNESDSQQLSANVHPNTSRENQLFAGFTEIRTSRLV